jgi:prolyl oligopeptidase
MPLRRWWLATVSLLFPVSIGMAQTTMNDAARPMQTIAGPAQAGDPYLWLEEVDSPRAMQWVRDHNASSTAVLEADPRYQTLFEEALTIADATDRIPDIRFIGDAVYNFWTDAQHPRGIWRRTTLADYQSPHPQWTVLLDIDALGKAEGRSWVFHGANCFMPSGRRCLIALSDGGEDATELREFDLDSARFVDGGFHLPRAKQWVVWEDGDHLLVARPWSDGDATSSGYPYVVKRLTRGAALDAAVEIFRGTKTDVSVLAQNNYDATERVSLIRRSRDFFHSEYHLVAAGGLKRLALPEKASILNLVSGRLIVRLRESWTANGQTFDEGAVVHLELAEVRADPDRLKPHLVWSPGPWEAFVGLTTPRATLLLATMDNVRGRAWAYSAAPDGKWTRTAVDLPDNMSISLGSSDDNSELSLLYASDFLTPPSLWLVDDASGKARPIKTLPARFDASGLTVEQHEAVSSDGTKVPYFIVHRKDMKLDGSTPTWMHAYGGFEASLTPGYRATSGKLWLERGGALVLANIRGGGEFGPRWHEAGLGTKRQLVYDDFTAIARDLIARGITSPRRLGIEGGSNGGLLMGVQFTQHPELWNAVVISIPLLDMLRISNIAAGASWIGEYGDVNADPAVRTFWEKTSPYQNLRAGTAYPEPFIFTTTKDDRVGPQHARKFAARLEEMKLPVLYFENTEGGHGSGADHRQAARSTTLFTVYMQKKLMD